MLRLENMVPISKALSEDMFSRREREATIQQGQVLVSAVKIFVELRGRRVIFCFIKEVTFEWCIT